MDFNLTVEQNAVKQMVRDFVEKEVKPIAAENDRTSTFPMDVFKKIGDMGLFALPFPKKYGGMGGDYLSYILSVEEIAKACASTGLAYSVHVSLCSSAIYMFGNENQKLKYLPDLLSGKRIGAFALTEANAGTDAAGGSATAILSEDYYILNGEKKFTTNGPIANTYLVFALTDKTKGAKGMSAFIVEKDFPGVSVGKIEDKMGLRAAQVSEMCFTDCKIPKENLLGKEGDGFKIAMKILDGGRIGIAAQALGISEGALEETLKYVAKRKQFGKEIFKFQGPSWMLADMDVKIEQARYLTYKAAFDKDNNLPYSVSAARAKLTASDTALYVTQEGIQLLGGYGYMKDFPLERMMRDSKITQIYEGTNQVQKMVISGALFR